MDFICINELLPEGRKIRKILSGSELIFAYELDKYTRMFLNRRVTLKNVGLAKSLIASEYFSFVYNNGLDFGVVVDPSILVKYSASYKSTFFTGTVENLVYKSITPELWVYDFTVDKAANTIANAGNRSAAHVSIVACMIVDAFAKGVSCPRIVFDNTVNSQLELAYVDLLILKLYGNRILDGVFDIIYSNHLKQQPEWEAYITFHRQCGLMNKDYTSLEKYRYLKKHLGVGDVVLLYKRAKAAKGQTISSLISCYAAVITDFNKQGVSLTYYPFMSTKLTRSIELSTLEKEHGEELILTQYDYDKFPVCSENFDMTSLGVGTCTYLEQFFIIKPTDYDGSYQYFKVGGNYERVYMSTVDTIYAVFEDRGVVYNRDKFLHEYFTSRGREPLVYSYL